MEITFSILPEVKQLPLFILWKFILLCITRGKKLQNNPSLIMLFCLFVLGFILQITQQKKKNHRCLSRPQIREKRDSFGPLKSPKFLKLKTKKSSPEIFWNF